MTTHSRLITASPCTALVLVLALCLAPAASAQAPPNILLILVDDLGIEHLDFYGIGSQYTPTPNLTDLAAGKLVFTQAWSNPVSSPTRIGIETGRYAFRTGIGEAIPHTDDNALGMSLDELTLPEMLKENTPTPYAAGAFGKWHLGANDSIGGLSAPNWAGYDHFDGMLVREQEQPIDYFDYVATTDGVSHAVTTYSTTYIVDAAIDWINATSGPWYAHVAFWAFPEHWPPGHLHTQDTSQQSVLVQFRAMTEAVDTEIGRLLDSIDTTNTLVIVTTDNGSEPPANQPPVMANRAKGTVFQGGIRVPLVIWGDMVTAGTVDSIVNLTDLYATIGEMAGATLPTDVELDSISLVPYFTDPSAGPLREFAYTETFSPNGEGPYDTGQQAVRDARYKYLRNTAGGEGLLDLAVDPWETNNLLAGTLTPEEQAAFDALNDHLDELMGICTLGQQGDPCSSDEDCCSGTCKTRRGRSACVDLAF